MPRIAMGQHFDELCGLERAVPSIATPVVEQEFVNLVSNACYKILENPYISHVRLKTTVESVFRVMSNYSNKILLGVLFNMLFYYPR